MTDRQDKPMRAWLRESDSHGYALHSPSWLPDGDEPDHAKRLYVRAPWLDQPSATPEPDECGTCDGSSTVFDHNAGAYVDCPECDSERTPESEHECNGRGFVKRDVAGATSITDCPQCRAPASPLPPPKLFSETPPAERSPEAAGVYPTHEEIERFILTAKALGGASATVRDTARTLVDFGVDWANKRAAARSPECTCNIHPCQPHERWCPKSEHYGEAKEAEGYHRGYADALASVAQEMGIDGRDRADLTAWIAAARSPGGTPKPPWYSRPELDDIANAILECTDDGGVPWCDIAKLAQAYIDDAEPMGSPGGTLTADECEDAAASCEYRANLCGDRKTRTRLRETANKLRAGAQPPTPPVLTAEECEAASAAVAYAHSRHWAADIDAHTKHDLKAIAAKLRAGAQPPMGLTREDVERICGYLANFNEPATRALAARLRSLPTSTDRVLATPEIMSALKEWHRTYTVYGVLDEEHVAARMRLRHAYEAHVTPTTEGEIDE